MHMRGLLLLLLLWPCMLYAAITFPALTGRVVDGASVIDTATHEQIESRLAAYEQSTGIQIVVVTLSSLQGMPIEDYGYQLGRHWGIGQKGKNTGALLIVAPQEHQTRIEVGYGLEGQLTDATSHLIIEHMLPYFKRGSYSAGIDQGVNAMIEILGGSDSATQPATARSSHDDISLWSFLLPIFLFFIIFRSSRRGRSGLIAPLILGSMLGGGSRSGGFSGFSGGGGSFGGGGASGRW